MKRRAFLASGGIIGAVVLSGCSGDEQTSSDVPTTEDSSSGDSDDGSDTQSDDSIDDDNGETGDPAEFVLENVSYPESTNYDESFEVSVIVQNSGEQTGETTVAFEFANGEVQEEEIELEGGESTTLTYTVDATGYEGAIYELETRTEDDSHGGTVEIAPEPEPATFEIGSVAYPDTVDYDTDFDITVEVRNVGDIAGETTVITSIAEDAIDETSVEVAGGESESVTTTVGDDVLFDGEYDLTVEAANDEYSASLFVDNPNPWGKPTVEVGLEQQVDAIHDIHDIIDEALTYWEENSETFAGYPLSYEFQPNSTDPDILIAMVEEIGQCGFTSGDHIAGCAPLIQDDAPDTALVRVVNGYRTEWTVTIIKHEIGHTLGLDHSAEPQHIMSDDPNDRIPDYEDRIEAIAEVRASHQLRSDGMSHWSTGLDAIEAADGYTAEEEFTSAFNYFAAGREANEIALTIAEDLGEDEAIELLEEGVNHFEELEEMAAYAVSAAQAFQNGNYDDSQYYAEQSDHHNEQADSFEVPSESDIFPAFGLPYQE